MAPGAIAHRPLPVAVSQRGFTIIELIVVMMAAASLAVIFLPALSTTVAVRDTEASGLMTLDLVRRAQSHAMSGRQASRWGVHFQGDRAVLFRGASYSPADPDNEPVILSEEVRITAVTLTPGGACTLPAGTGNCDVIVAQPNGAPEQAGTVVITGSSGDTMTLTVSAAGLTDFERVLP